jgi:hypothetical protein
MHLIRPQEHFRRGKTLHPPSDGSDQILERTPEGVVIVNNRNVRKSWHVKSVAPFPIYLPQDGYEPQNRSAWPF